MSDMRLRPPSKKSIENAIKVIEDFRDVCKHQLDLGYWATVDFPSKHHVNKILQIQYLNKDDVYKIYGSGLTNKALSMIPICKAYVNFLRDDHGKLENEKQRNSFKK